MVHIYERGIVQYVHDTNSYNSKYSYALLGPVQFAILGWKVTVE